jgi:hypothetical protein
MKNFYEVGRVYVWQNLQGAFAYLNGKETTVTGDAKMHSDRFGNHEVGQTTDTSTGDGGFFIAGKGMLRPRRPPPGEQSVLDMFKQPDMVDA